MLRDLIKNNRSYRRFNQAKSVDPKVLLELVGFARCSASAGNMQPLKYLIAHTPEAASRVFPSLAWAAYLKDWAGPGEGERPPAYIIILGDTSISKNFHCDHGIAAQSILLGAVEHGLGGCILGAINRKRLSKAMKIEPRYEILLVIALGEPAEEVVLEDASGDIKYWRDKAGVHHVPKRPLEELVLRLE